MLTADPVPVDEHSVTVRSRAEVRVAKLWVEIQAAKLQKTPNPILHSGSLLPGKAMDAILRSEADVINLHWVNGGFLSIEQIGKLMKERRVFWTLHDMWAFCGAEHYDDPDGSERWVSGYQQRLAGRRIDLDRLTWKRKNRSWRHPAQIIAPSKWMADCVTRSALMCNWPVAVIPNPLDTTVFRPHDSALARELLGLPQDVPLLLFGAIGGSSDPRKGWDLLRDALPAVVREIGDLELVVLGQRTAPEIPGVNVPVHPLGHLHDDVTLALAYSAATCVVVPSRQDNLPQAATEPTACGTPVVAFATGGLPDIVEHEKTGYLAEPFDVTDLAHGIAWTLTEEVTTGVLGIAARTKAVDEWSPEVVGRKYAQLLGSDVEDRVSDTGSESEGVGA